MSSSNTFAQARISPYQGLVPYTEEDYAYFFGRDHEIAAISSNLAVARLTLFYGPSGVGKTSVLRAGVIHRLQDQAQKNHKLYGNPEQIAVYFNRWHEEPLIGLRQAIVDALQKIFPEEDAEIALNQKSPAPLQGQGKTTSSFFQELQTWKKKSDYDLLIVLDQFEEYFLYSKTPGADDFANTLIQAVNNFTLRVNFLLSLREDALARLDHFKGRIPFLLDNRMTLQRLTRDNARIAIEKPLDRYSTESGQSYTIEPELTETIIDHLVSSRAGLARQGQGTTNQPIETIEAPYLQLVLIRLWVEELSTGSTILQLETLNRMQGTAAIVTNYLEETMSKLSASERAMATRFFDRLVTPSGSKIALSLEDLIGYAGADEADVSPLLQILLHHRILQDVPSLRGELLYEITHDVLGQAILGWQGYYKAKLEHADILWQKARETKELATRRQLLEQALALVSNHINAQADLTQLERANALWRKAQETKEPTGRRQLLEQALALVPDLADVQADLTKLEHADVLWQKAQETKDPTERLQLLQELYISAPDHAGVLSLTQLERAEILWQKARETKELATRRHLLEEALRLSPNHAGAQAGLTRLQHEEQAAHAGAQAGLRRLQNEEQAAHLYAAAVAYIDNEQWRDAQRTLEQVAQRVPNFRDTRSRLAEVLGKLSPEPIPVPTAQIDQVEQYRSIFNVLLEGRLTIFLGGELGGVGRPLGDRWVEGLYPPGADDAARALARYLPPELQGRESLLQVSQYTLLFDGEPALYDRLSALYNGDFTPTMLHRLLAELPARLAARGYPKGAGRRYVLFSSALDDLLERAFAEAGQPYHLFAYRPRFVDDEGVVQVERFLHLPPATDPASSAVGEPIAVLEPNKYNGHDSDNHPILVKLCGRRVTSEPDSVAVTEDHYLNYVSVEKTLAVLPTTLLTQIKRHSFLFFGHSLQPWHLRLLWQRLRLPSGDRQPPRWAIMPILTRIEERFWQSQRIEPIVASPEGVVAYINDWLESL